MRNRTLPLPLLLVSSIAAGLLAPVTSSAADARVDRIALELSVDEIQDCCRGDLRRADLDAQRRWGYNLYRWLAASDGKPDLSSLADSETLERQCAKVSPEYAAVITAHPGDWLVEHRAELPKGSGVRPAPRFVEAFYMLVPLEVERRQAVAERDEARQRIDLAFERTVADIEGSRTLIDGALAGSRAAGGAFDPAVAFAARRSSLQASVDELERQIAARREAFWGFEKDWDEANEGLAYGTYAYSIALAEFEKKAKTANDEILLLTEQMVALTLRRDALATENADQILARIEAPPTGTARRLGPRAGGG